MPTLSTLWVWKCLRRTRASQICFGLQNYTGEHRFIAGFSKCTTKDLLCLLTKLLSTVRWTDKVLCYYDQPQWGKQHACCRHSTNWISVRTATSVQTYDFSTLYASIPHKWPKSRIASLVHNTFKKKDGSTRCTHIKLDRGRGYFINSINGGG